MMIARRSNDDRTDEEASMTLTTHTGISLGERSPDWSLPRLDGGDIGPALLRGTKTLYFFWASW
jgi:hypothetical protein